MKKALRILMLALLVVPCALVFTACGKNVGNSEVSRYVFESYKKAYETSEPDTWRNQKMTTHIETKRVQETEVEYKKAATDTDTVTETKEFVTETKADMTVERNGQEEDAVLIITAKVVTTTTTYAADTTDQTLKNTITTTTQEVTLNLGRIGAEDTGAYYVASKVYTEGKQTVNGVEDKEYEGAAGAPQTTKTAQKVEVGAYGQTLTSVGSILTMFQQMPYSSLSILAESEAGGAEVKRTQNGKNLTITISQKDAATYENGLMSATAKTQFNNYDLVNYDATTKIETFDTTSLMSATQDMNLNINFEYASNATMLTESDIATYDEGSVDLSQLQQLLGSIIGILG